MVTNGRTPIGGLTAADFELRDNGVLQSVELLASETPINAVLALDISSSTDGQRQADLQRAGEALLSGLGAGDRAALTTFNQAVTLRMPLSTDLAAVRASLTRIVPSGETAMMDGLFVALTTTYTQPGRSLVVVCTDGNETSSWLTAGEVLEAAKRSNAVVYAVTTAQGGTPPDITNVAEATGGQALQVGSGAALGAAFQRILSDFRSRYVLAFTPAGVDPGGWHRLEVRVKRPGLSTRARPGYVGVSARR